MIYNATLQRVDAAVSSTPSGDVTYAAGAAIAVRCCQDEPSYSIKYVLGVVIQDATAMLIVQLSDLPAGVTIDRGNQVLVTEDRDSQRKYEVLFRRDRIKEGGLSHYEVFLKGL